MSAIHTHKEANLNNIIAQLLTRKVPFYQELLTRQGVILSWEGKKYFNSVTLNERQSKS